METVGGTASRSKPGKVRGKATEVAAKPPKGAAKAGAKKPGAARGKGGGKARAGDPAAKAKKLKKQEELRADIARELAHLRESLETASKAVAARLDAEIVGLLDAFEGKGIPGEPVRLPPARVQALMLSALKELRVKPEKGRLKDLGRMGDLADRLQRLMPQGG